MGSVEHFLHLSEIELHQMMSLVGLGVLVESAVIAEVAAHVESAAIVESAVFVESALTEIVG